MTQFANCTTLMLLTRSLPPQFLLPAWSARQLAKFVKQRAYQSTEQKPRSPNEPHRKAPVAQSSTPSPVRSRSLFEELFPEEADAKLRAAEKRLEKLPAFRWNGDLSSGTLKRKADRKQNSNAEQVQWNKSFIRKVEVKEPLDFPNEEKRHSETGVLLLSAVSKNLEESDFFRLGPRGEHIEGWTSGITKVIPARDFITLEPLGYYFILFSSDAAASAYLDNMIRLHKLSKAHGSAKATRLAFSTRYLKPGEDAEDALRGFSLVPSQGALSLRQLQRPYTPHVSQIIKDGFHPSIAQLKNVSDDMVLFSSSTGHFTEQELKEALKMDGRRRNLPWKLAGKQNDILKINADQLLEDEGGVSYGAQRPEARKRTFQGPARFAIAFKDRHEARRFVREWHRRPLPVKRGYNLEGEDPPVVNAEILW